ncbi:MAG: type 4a pilus biogenesis protein PilO [Phycisphaerae bacterium]|nr:type 4a pilus biogenesis protein PilO [Phycisphaerae bacterium]
MAKLRQTAECWMMPVLTVAMGVGATVAVYVPQSHKLQSIKTGIASRKLVLADNSKKAAVVPRMMREVQVLKSRYKDFDSRLPRSKELGGFLQEITAIQQNSALVDPRMETGSPVSEELFNTMPIKMRLRGRYMALTDFLRRLGQMRRLTRVQRLMVSIPQQEGDDLSVELLLNIYFTKN